MVSSWKLVDAKAKFSELVRRARREGAQIVTVRGRESAVVMSAEEYQRLCLRERGEPLLRFLRRLDLAGLDLTRDPDYGRDVEL